MKADTMRLKYEVLTTAAELIRGYLETGITDEELGFKSTAWTKEANRLCKTLQKKAEKYKPPSPAKQ